MLTDAPVRRPTIVVVGTHRAGARPALRNSDEEEGIDMEEGTGIGIEVPIDAGTTVEVRSRFDQRWTTGFTVADVAEEGYLLRRQSDGTVLPAWFPREQLRPLGRTA
ncbi:hypothetical protein [Dermatobacter hominis]|uniref:hypothetical protein n=1 Tax=Dermatobacter hominis TaxID=2884263 RepID=UPI001D11B8A9|nr:hypothetical protein [Dermatobacter hominis]UDY37011.1 hypothetical protein LH044_05605 [Dermatobacter hominis]